jgi:transposase
MTQEEIALSIIPSDKFDHFTREELILLLKGEQSLRQQMESRVRELEAIQEELKQRSFQLGEQLVTIKSKLYGKSSERRPRPLSGDPGEKKKGVRVLLPSERYPDAPLIEREVRLDILPSCRCCGGEMSESGMTEDSEHLTVVPKQYFLVRVMRHKYRCPSCHGDLVTAPVPPRIKEGSAYSDEMAIDVAMTKYCDLVPIERYAAMAEREGMRGLPPQSLIESTHYLADFVRPAYEKLRAEILGEKVLHADETPHRMLEGDKKSNWFLWGFSGSKTSYFECHPTRSGDVASALLTDSQCEFLVSDVFSGYAKAVRETSLAREALGRPGIYNVYCNAHARRRFKEAAENFTEEGEFYLSRYAQIYAWEAQAKERPPDEISELRKRIAVDFAAMKERALADLAAYPLKSSLGRAMSYFLQNYTGLTQFLADPALPIDNNPQERLLRNPVIGRKTWYGTHSKQGAETAAVLFSLVQSCKLNRINPREYFKRLVKDLHAGGPASTPAQFVKTG